MMPTPKLLLVLICLAGLAGCDGMLTESGQWSGSISLYWSEPLEREDGTPLNATDIQGYEIRYRPKGASEYTAVFVEGYAVDSYHFDNLPDPENLTIEIAVVDNNGLYSDFVTAQ